MLNALLFQTVEFGSEDAWAGFDLQHTGMHAAVYDAMLKRNLVPFYVPLAGFPREDNTAYLLDHWQVHISNAELLNLPGIPDLGTVDLSDPLQFADWVQLHALVHKNENLALEIT